MSKGSPVDGRNTGSGTPIPSGNLRRFTDKQQGDPRSGNPTSGMPQVGGGGSWANMDAPAMRKPRFDHMNAGPMVNPRQSFDESGLGGGPTPVQIGSKPVRSHPTVKGRGPK